MKALFRRGPALAFLLSMMAVDTIRTASWYFFYAKYEYELLYEWIVPEFAAHGFATCITLVAFPLMLYKTGMAQTPAKMHRLFQTVLGMAAALFVVDLFIPAAWGIVFGPLTTVLITICLSICFMQASRCVENALLGRLVAVVYLTYQLILYLVEQFIGDYYLHVISAVIMVLFVVAGVNFSRTKDVPEQPAIPQAPAEKHYSRPLTVVILAGIALFSFILLMGDSLHLYYGYDPSFYFGKYLFIVLGLTYFISAWLMDTGRWQPLFIITAFILCVGHSSYIFFGNDTFSNLFAITLYVGFGLFSGAVIAAGLKAPRALGESRVATGTAHIFHYLFAGVANLIVPSLSEKGLVATKGTMSVLSLVALLMTFAFVIFTERRRQQQEAVTASGGPLPEAEPMAVVYARPDSAEMAIYAQALGLTKREAELLPMVLSPLKAEDIAKAECIALSTVRFHIKNILAKADAKNRDELRKTLAAKSGA